MRLICPDCGAQYEVPARVIPDEGRDVQCSACGNTWFQTASAGTSEDGSAPTAQQDQDDVTPNADMDEAQEPADIEPPIEHDAVDTDASDPAPEVIADTPPRRALDPQIAAILQEEAAREQQARSALQNTAPAAEATIAPSVSITEPEPQALNDDGDSAPEIELDAHTGLEPDESAPTLDPIPQDDATDLSQRDASEPIEPIVDEPIASTEDDTELSDIPKEPDVSTEVFEDPIEDPTEPEIDLDPTPEVEADRSDTIDELPLEPTPSDAEQAEEAQAPQDEEDTPLASPMAAALAALDASTQSSDQEDEPQDAFDVPRMPGDAPTTEVTEDADEYSTARLTPDDIEQSTVHATDHTDEPAHRRSRLPDIEEMSQSWSIVDEADARADEQHALLIAQARRKSGFNFGFFTVIFIAIAAAMIYWRADDIIDYMPQAEPLLDQYIDQIDMARARVQDMARAVGLWTIDLANEIKAESAIDRE